MRIEGCTALISGAASGLGSATARALVAAGARIVLVDLPASAGAQLAQDIGPSARFAPADVTRPEEVNAAIETACGHFGRLDVLVNCAGVGGPRRILGRDGPHDPEAFVRIVHINLFGTFNTMRLAAVAMANNSPNPEGERGVMINTASAAAFEGQIGQAAYAASKGGVVSLTLPAARELARHGIRVMAIAPGLFETPMLVGKREPQLVAALAAQVPFPSRLGRPEEYAALVLHVIGNPMLNGEVIRLDGALRMAPR